MSKVGLQISALSEKEFYKLPVILLLSLKRTMFCFAHEMKVPNYLRFTLSHTCNPYMWEKGKESRQPLFLEAGKRGESCRFQRC